MKGNDILFCGDVHGEFRHVLTIALQMQPMAVVLLGDIEAARPLHVGLEAIRDIVWWIRGNHDTDSVDSWSNLVDSELADRCLDGRVVTLPDGTRLAGLGGVFRESVWMPPAGAVHCSYDDWLRGGFRRDSKHPADVARRLKHRSTIFQADYLALAGQWADILVTHEAGGGHPHGFDAIDELASAMSVKATFHGHQHDRLDYSPRFERLGFQAFGVGLRGITGRDGSVIVRGELDDARSHRQVRS